MADPLAALRVFDRLEVGPVEVEPRRVRCPYRTWRDGEADEIELVYRWDEDVLDRWSLEAVNLAAVAAAQVALNYGLFAREIVLHGPFDRADRQLLRSMLRNTATEILVNKLLSPNPFLVGAAADLDQEGPLDPSHVARLVFTDPLPDLAPTTPWAEESGRVAIAASGGKDSLLSQGLLEELGCEVHPLFAAESGRHWLTALHAWRHLERTHPRAGKVWTNCDRVYGWMLRQLSFVRQDYARVRADIYPLRLWTVAVFTFGLLPLLRKRGIGTLVIGDEHDTSRRVEWRGHVHYDGLYDQSRWFDQAMSRYFHRKGWNVVQLSVLRPLSELLIEEILVQRYPELLRLQVSCHAAHVDGEVVRPCGQCEKCRRIVGMVLASGGDPGDCGYEPAQVERCLEDLARAGAHQEEEGEVHLGHLLVERGHVEPTSPLGQRAAPHPEVMRLRYDPDVSPITDVPPELREPLVRLLLEHARGAVRRRGSAWVEHDPLEARFLAQPWPWPRPQQPEPGPAGWVLGELTWPEARRRLAEVDVALLPVGAVEQHGPHLPLDTDAFDALRLALDVAMACAPPRPLVLPLMPYGVSYHHADFAGTLSVSPETLARVVHEVGMAAASHGVRKLLIVNGHGGNVPALQFAAQMINRDAHIFTAVDTGETSDAEITRLDLVTTEHDVHAGEIETSTTLALRPELVRMDLAEAHTPTFSNRYLDFDSSLSVAWYARTSRLSPTGVMGDPTLASAEKGQRIWSVMVRNLVELVEYLKGATLDEIYRRKV